jgi:hypothetical protein
LTVLNTMNPPLTWRLVPLQVLLAEAQRQCGDTTAALHTLRDSVAIVNNNALFKQSFVAPLCAALIASDLGDTNAADRLTTRWDDVRRAHGLPAPVGFVAAAGTLGLDPTPPEQPIRQWDPAALTSCLDNTRTWCAAALATRLPAGTMPDPA